MMTSKRDFIYQDRDDELLKRRMEKKSKSFTPSDIIFKQGFNVFKPHTSQEIKGTLTNKIRILPPTWKNAEHYGYEIWVHYNIGENKSHFICNKMTKGEPCPICEELMKHKDDKEYVKKIKANRKVIVWLIDREDEEGGPKLWAVPVGFDRTLAFQANDEDSGKVLKIDHPEKGFDIHFDTLKGAVEGIPYTYEGEKITRTSKPIFADEDKMVSVLEYITEHPITEVLNLKSYDYIKSVFEGKEKVEEEPEEEREEEIPVEQEQEKEEIFKRKEFLWKDLEGMDRDDLVDLAVDELGMKNRDIKSLGDDDLRRTIAEKMGIVITGKSSSDEMKRKIDAIRNRA